MRTLSSFARLALVVVIALLGGCVQTKPTQDLTALPPVAVGSALVYVLPALHSVAVVDFAANPPAVHFVAVGSQAVSIAARTGHPEVLVLCSGTVGDATTAPEPGRLFAIPISGTSPVRAYTVGSPFNAVDQTPEGRFAFVHFLASSSLDSLLFNPNEIAVADLDAAPSDASGTSPGNPLHRTVRSFGGVPTSVVFSPPLMLSGSPRTIATVLSPAYLTLIDMANLNRSEITVRLTLPQDTTSINPAQVLFDTDNQAIYLRGAADDIFVISLAPQAQAMPTDNDFAPSINQLAVGHSPSDMALFGDPTARRLLVVAPGSSEVDVLDAASNNVTAIPLIAPADRLLMFSGPSPQDPTTQPRALLYAADLRVQTLSFLDLTNVESRRGLNVEPIQLPDIIVGAVPVPSNGVMIVQHPGAVSTPGMSLISLTDRTASPIYAQVELQFASFGVDQQTLWVAVPGDERLGFLDLLTYHPGQLLLDAPVNALLPLPSDPSGNHRVVAVHNGIGGYVTVVSGTAPLRSTAISFRGFLLDGLVQRGSP